MDRQILIIDEDGTEKRTEIPDGTFQEIEIEVDDVDVFDEVYLQRLKRTGIQVCAAVYIGLLITIILVFVRRSLW